MHVAAKAVRICSFDVVIAFSNGFPSQMDGHIATRHMPDRACMQPDRMLLLRAAMHPALPLRDVSSASKTP
jgi:hypothetical protein